MTDEFAELIDALHEYATETLHIAIVGSRDYPRLERVESFVDRLPPKIIVVSGGARGVDTAAVDRARARGIRTKVFRPDYGAYGKVIAPAIRNTDIVNESGLLVAFLYRDSSGTMDAIKKAHRKCIPVRIYN